MAYHLLCSKSGLQFSDSSQTIQCLTSTDLAGISTAQFRRIDELQRRIIKEEKILTEKMAKVQESVADASMVELSHTVTQLMQSVGGSDQLGQSLLNGGRGKRQQGEEGEREREERKNKFFYFLIFNRKSHLLF
ncbi:hypothetical protein LINPERHAP2_LOCUS33422 [Linum perenne]